jgi:hypothetical protein
MRDKMYKNIEEEYKAFKKKEENKNHRYKKHILKIVDKPVKWNGYELFYYFENPELNILENIRKDVFEYFNNNKIRWWKISKDELHNYEGLSDKELSREFPTGNMLSSQVSCINHLFFLRNNQNLATIVLKKIDKRIVKAVMIDDSYIEFEKMGGNDQNPLGEVNLDRERGALSTSIDALMIGEKENGKNILVLIEWKYTEKGEDSFHNSQNHPIYKKLLQHKNCPINVPNDIETLLHEPYYQPMRQALLGWKMVELNEYNCDEYINIHIIPQGNTLFRKNLETPINWKALLKDQDKYKIISPEELLQPLYKIKETNYLFNYLYNRYIEKYN